MKLPAREIAIDALEDLWRNCKCSDNGSFKAFADIYPSDDDAKAPTAKHLAKWRPQVLASESKPNLASAPNGLQHTEDSKRNTSSVASPPSTAFKAGGEQMKNNQATQAVAAAG